MGVSTLKGKRLELSTPNFLHIHSRAVAWRALTWRSKGQSQGHVDTKIITVVLLLLVWDCLLYDWLGF